VKKLELENFIKKAITKHGNKYDYSEIKYKTATKKVKIICREHGSFLQKPFNHYNRGQGCPKCGIKKQARSTITLIEQFIATAIEIHNNKYNYSKTIYTNSRTKTIIICPEHGPFLQTPSDHIYKKHGCSKCNGGIKLELKDYIKKAKIIHGNIYDYSKVKYINCHTKIEIICPIHGSFQQDPHSHLSGHRCKKCTTNISKASQTWLDNLNISPLLREKTIKVINRRFIVDGFDPSTNTIYEYNGSFWHGDPQSYDPKDINKVTGKTFGQLYQKTINRQKALENAGYKVVSKWGH
jgi:hypothetical protein